jgi:hypothetical protein
VVATFRAETYCLDHLCDRGYEELGRIQVEQARETGSDWTAQQLAITDECARRALDICMGAQELNNLERARLLDILLWCGELVDSLQKNVPAKPKRARFPYEKPELRQRRAGAVAGF